ncbi:MAG: MFS transporter [Gemmatimonadetes bacterium]|nr:MFS transporter [Gemmatimonadota bacterium]MYG16452.1 MFS transporter [Gemmatimonadota bacterium]
MGNRIMQQDKKLTRLQTARGMRMWNVNGMLESVHSAITTGVYTTGYALHLGASSAMIGFISASISIGQLLQAISPLLIERLQRRKPLCLSANAVSSSLWLPIAFIPFLFFEVYQVLALMGCIALSKAVMSLVSPARQSWLTDLVPDEMRGRFVARQRSLTASAGLITSVCAGFFLSTYAAGEEQGGFTTLFIVAVVFSGFGVWAWSRIPEPQKTRGEHVPSNQLLRLPFRHGPFRRLMFLVSGRLLIAQIAAPFFTVYMLRTLEVSYAQIAIYSAIQTIATIIMNPFWGYLADKYGYKPVMSLTAVGLALFPLGWGFVTLENYWIMVPLVQVWGGSMSAGWGTARFNLIVKTAPAINRSAFLGCYSAVSRGCAACGAVLGGIAADLCTTIPAVSLFGYTFAGLQYLFLANGALRFAYMGLLARVPSDSQVSSRDVINRVRKGNPIATLWHLVRMGKSSNPSVRARAARELGETGSHLAVDELIALLEDSDRNVRREAVQSLSRIGAVEAVNPLLECVGSPSSDIAEEAVEALGAVPSSLSLNILVTLLHDERPGIRRSAILALDRIGDRRAETALEALLEHERDPAIIQSALETLARMGSTGILGRLQDLIRSSETSLERGVLVMSAGHLLGASDLLYRLLQSGEMDQDRATVRIFRSARRQLGGWSHVERAARNRFTEAVDRAMVAFERQQTGEVLKRLVEIARDVVAEAGPDRPDRPDHATEDTAPAEGPAARPDDLELAYRVLADLESEGRSRTLHAEERLLAVVAFQRMADLATE